MQNPVEQRDQDVISFEGFTGLRNDRPVEKLGVRDLSVADNVDINRAGMLTRRAGVTLVSSTPTHSLWSDGGSTGLAVQGTSLVALKSDLSVRVLRTGLMAKQRMSYAKANDLVFFSNGFDLGVVDNGQARSWGLTVPPRMGVTVSATGSMPAGEYQYASTYLATDGQESGMLSGRTVTVTDNGAITFALTPSADPRVVAQIVYLSEPNGDTLFDAVHAANSSTSATYSDSTLELNVSPRTQFFSPPPAGQVVGYYKGRMFVAQDDVLFPSEPYAFELFDLRKYIQLSGRITLIAAVEDKEQSDQGVNSGLFLGTDRGCGVLVGSNPDEFRYVAKTEYGAIPGTLTYVDASTFTDGAMGARAVPLWLTTEGICAGMPQMEIKNLTRTKYSFSAAGQGAALFQRRENRVIMSSNY